MKQNTESISFVKGYLQSNRIPVYLLKDDFSNLSDIDLTLGVNIFNNNVWRNYIRNTIETLKKDTLYFFRDSFDCNYSCIYTEQGFFLAGPVLWEPITEEKYIKIKEELEIKDSLTTSMFEYYQKIPVIPARSFYNNLFHEIAKTFHGDEYKVEYNSIIIQKSMTYAEYNLFQSLETTDTSMDLSISRSNLENDLINSVLSGNEAVTLELYQNNLDFFEKYFTRRMQNRLRDIKDYTISLNTLLKKALEYHGIHPIFLENISDQFIIETEQCCNIKQIQKLHPKILSSYCHVVSTRNHSKHSPCIEAALCYIDSNLNADLSLRSIAKLLNVNSSYFSALFSQEMGCALTSYVTEKRIDFAKFLLSTTAIPIKAIVVQCGFSDFSYFCKIFKKSIGMSPKNYRENLSLEAKKLLFN